MHLLSKVGIAVVTQVLICLGELIYEDSLFDRSLELIPDLQEGASDFKQTSWNVYSNYGLWGI